MPASVSVVLYTRHGCHLCDDAGRVLRDAGLNPKEVDIDLDLDLVAKHGLRVPVVVINGRERFFGRVDPVLLRRLLKAERLV